MTKRLLRCMHQRHTLFHRAWPRNWKNTFGLSQSHKEGMIKISSQLSSRIRHFSMQHRDHYLFVFLQQKIEYACASDKHISSEILLNKYIMNTEWFEWGNLHVLSIFHFLAKFHLVWGPFPFAFLALTPNTILQFANLYILFGYFLKKVLNQSHVTFSFSRRWDVSRIFDYVQENLSK